MTTVGAEEVLAQPSAVTQGQLAQVQEGTRPRTHITRRSDALEGTQVFTQRMDRCLKRGDKKGVKEERRQPFPPSMKLTHTHGAPRSLSANISWGAQCVQDAGDGADGNPHPWELTLHTHV